MDRKRLKEWAKSALHKNYWKSVLVSVIFFIATFFTVYFISYGISFGMGYGTTFGIVTVGALFADGGVDTESIIAIGITMLFMVGIGLIFFAVGAASKAFLANPVEIGCKKYLCKSLYKSETGLGEMGAGFKKDYKNIAKTMFVRDIYIGLWAALCMTVYMILGMAVLFGGIFLMEENSYKMSEFGEFLWMFLLVMVVYAICITCFIPMYIKVLHYMCIPYILADKPDMPRKEVFELSKKMIQGDKWNVFVMHLSFIGWLILSGCTCYILHIFYVGPYMEYTNAAYYEALKQKVGWRPDTLCVIEQ